MLISRPSHADRIGMDTGLGIVGLVLICVELLVIIWLLAGIQTALKRKG